MPCRPDRLTRAPVPLGARLLAAPAAFVVACALSPLPVLALWAASGGVDPGSHGATLWGPAALGVLLFLPVLLFLVGLFAGPFALPVLVLMAALDLRGLPAHVALGMAVTLPAMAAFSLAVPDALNGPVAGAILAGGALGGFAASAARDFVEE